MAKAPSSSSQEWTVDIVYEIISNEMILKTFLSLLPVDQVVKLCHKAVFDNTGQICSAASRTLVHHSIYDEFVSKSVQLAVNRRLGDPFDQETDQGPQVLHLHSRAAELVIFN